MLIAHALTCSLALASTQPHAGDASQDTPSVLIELSVLHVHDATWLADKRVRDQEGNAVHAQGFGTGPEVYVAAYPTLTDQNLHQDELLMEMPVLTSPRVMALSGQEAVMAIGEQIPFATLHEEDDTLHVDHDSEVYEGISIELVPEARPSGAIAFSTLEIGMTRLVGRLDVVNADGERTVALPAGKPIMRTISYSLPITLPEGEHAMIVLTPNGKDAGDEAYIVMVRASVVEED